MLASPFRHAARAVRALPPMPLARERLNQRWAPRLVRPRHEKPTQTMMNYSISAGTHAGHAIAADHHVHAGGARKRTRYVVHESKRTTPNKSKRACATHAIPVLSLSHQANHGARPCSHFGRHQRRGGQRRVKKLPPYRKGLQNVYGAPEVFSPHNFKRTAQGQ